MRWYTRTNVRNERNQCNLHCVVPLTTHCYTRLPTPSPPTATTSTDATGHWHTIARVGRNSYELQISASAWQVTLPLLLLCVTLH